MQSPCNNRWLRSVITKPLHDANRGILVDDVLERGGQYPGYWIPNSPFSAKSCRRFGTSRPMRMKGQDFGTSYALPKGCSYDTSH